MKNTTLYYDQDFNYQEFKLKILKELKEVEDRLILGKSEYYDFLKKELKKELKYVNQVIKAYYYR